MLVPRMSFTMCRSSSLVAGAENDFHDAQVVVPGSSGAAAHSSEGCGEVNLNDAQLLPVSGLLEKGTSRGQREVADVVTVWPSPSAVSSVVGRRRQQAPVPPPVAEAIALRDSAMRRVLCLSLKIFASIRVENPSSRVARVTTALHLNSYSTPTRSLHVVHNSHARMSHARCVVNSVGDTEDERRLSCVYGGTKSLSTRGKASCCREACFSTAGVFKVA